MLLTTTQARYYIIIIMYNMQENGVMYISIQATDPFDFNANF